MTPWRKFDRGRVAFTLVELLVVMAIIVALAAVISPALRLPESTKLTAAGSQIVASLAFARQVAQTQNRPVEVRLYALAPNGQAANYSAMGLFLVGDDGKAQPRAQDGSSSRFCRH